jgi:hypothetical protein
MKKVSLINREAFTLLSSVRKIGMKEADTVDDSVNFWSLYDNLKCLTNFK